MPGDCTGAAHRLVRVPVELCVFPLITQFEACCDVEGSGGVRTDPTRIYHAPGN